MIYDPHGYLFLSVGLHPTSAPSLLDRLQHTSWKDYSVLDT